MSPHTTAYMGHAAKKVKQRKDKNKIEEKWKNEKKTRKLIRRGVGGDRQNSDRLLNGFVGSLCAILTLDTRELLGTLL
jgi:hypothetical protein